MIWLGAILLAAGLFMCSQNTKAKWGPVLAILGAALVLVWLISPARAHDHEHPELNQWYAGVKQPDTGISCCGPSDAYWCNEKARGAQVVCVIDDDRADRKLNRKPVPNGTVIQIPQHKINKDPNPTGRAVVWLSPTGHVWCFVGISGS